MKGRRGGDQEASRRGAERTAWSSLVPRLAGLDSGEILDLLQALFERSADNQRFLAARLAGEDSTAVLEDYRERVLAEFVLTEPPRMPRLGQARKAIRDYRKAAADDDGAAELMLACVEAGTHFGRAHGDLGDAFYASLGNVLRDLAAAIRARPGLYARLSGRLEELRRDSKRVGWTWGLHVAEVVDGLEAQLGDH